MEKGNEKCIQIWKLGKINNAMINGEIIIIRNNGAIIRTIKYDVTLIVRRVDMQDVVVSIPLIIV